MWYKVKKIYVWSTKVRPAYKRVPWANTIAYYPLTASTTTSDQSWNSRNLTNSWNITFWTNQWVSCASFNKNWNLYVNNFYNLSQWDYTISLWAYKLTQSSASYAISIWDWSTRWGSCIIEYDNSVLRYAMWYDDLDSSTNPSNQWVNIVITYTKNSKTQNIYVNWGNTWTRTATYTHTLPSLKFCVWWDSSWSDLRWTWYMNEVIVENKAWTADEISNYYNWTKSNYGL